MDMVKELHKVVVVNFQIFHQNIFIQLIRILLMNKEWILHDTDTWTKTSTRTSHMYVGKGSIDNCFI